MSLCHHQLDAGDKAGIKRGYMSGREGALML